MRSFQYLAVSQLFMIFFGTFYLSPLMAQTDRIKRIQTSSTAGMQDAAKSTVRMLETSINAVIQYAHENKNADILIDDTILPSFKPNATIETANLVKGIEEIKGQKYRTYFIALYNKAKRVPDLKVYFLPAIEVVFIDRYKYQCKVKYSQIWSSERYSDLTDKIVDVYFEKHGNNFIAIIGDIKVVPNSVKIFRK